MNAGLYFIDDGYTEQARIAEDEGIHGELLFSFRPMTHDQREQVAGKLSSRKASETVTIIMARAIAHHVTEWNIELERTVANICRLRPALLDKLYAVVAGLRKSDPLPTGETPAGYDEGADLKNS